MSKTMYYCVTITSCKGATHTDTIWNSYAAAEAHLAKLGFAFKVLCLKNADGTVRYACYNGGDPDHEGKDYAHITALPLNDYGTDKQQVLQHYKMRSADMLTADERAAIGIYTLMSMYSPEEILCVITRDMHVEEANKCNTPILDNGHDTKIYYMLMTQAEHDAHGDPVVPMHHVISISDTNSMSFYREAYNWNEPAYVHKHDVRLDTLTIDDSLYAKMSAWRHGDIVGTSIIHCCPR